MDESFNELCIDEADRKEAASLKEMNEQEYCTRCAFSDGCPLSLKE